MSETGKPVWQLPPGIIEADTDQTAPRRRYRLALDAHGDTLDDLLDALYDIVQQWEERTPDPGTAGCARISGGSRSGYYLRVGQDPTVTRDSYLTALSDWLNNSQETPA